MSSQESRPGNDYYERPYIPNSIDRNEWKTLPLRPIEAHSLLVNSDNLSERDKRALREIVEGDYHPDQEVDFFSFFEECIQQHVFHSRLYQLI